MPEDTGDSFRSGMAAFREQRYDEAVSHFSQAIREHAVVHKSYNALGVTYSILGEPGEAAICFEKAVAIEPENQTYQKNLNALSRGAKTVVTGIKTRKRPRRSFRETNTRIMFAVTLVVVISIALIGLQSEFDLSSRMGLIINGAFSGGFLTPWVNSLQEDAVTLPVPVVRVEEKRIEFFFDRDQDLKTIEKIETVLTTTKDSEDHLVKLPVIVNPQKSLYYAVDDPFFGKQKHIVMTAYYQNGVSGILIDRNLPPR
jgi:tetratricopeptide (TPR) repeat protein